VAELLEVDKSKVWVIIAAYNEEGKISDTVADVLKFLDNVVVVDDCSTDDTFQRALYTKVHVLRHPINLGQGAALQTGIQYAKSKGCDYVVTFDGDGQHRADEILPMLYALMKGGADIVLGSRFLGVSLNLRWSRRLILKAAIVYTWITTGMLLSDVHNGFRIMTRSFCERFEFRQNRMSHASEILNYIAKHKVRYIEFPVTIAYTEYSIKKGQRSSNSLRVILELLMGYITK
jgi:glycosyltransferase involved in cell wall biosynthesis